MSFEEWYKVEFNCHPNDVTSVDALRLMDFYKSAYNAGRREGVSKQALWQGYLDRCNDGY
jgi:predicted DNA-binding protein (UPF0251 family)